MKHQIQLAPVNLPLTIFILIVLLIQPLRTFFSQTNRGFQTAYNLQKHDLQREMKFLLGHALQEGDTKTQVTWLFQSLFYSNTRYFLDPKFRSRWKKFLRKWLPEVKIIQFDGKYQIEKEASVNLGIARPFQKLLELIADSRDRIPLEPAQKNLIYELIVPYFGKDTNISPILSNARKVCDVEDGPGNPALIAWDHVKINDIDNSHLPLIGLSPMSGPEREKHKAVTYKGLILLVRTNSIPSDFGPKRFLLRQKKKLKEKKLGLGWISLRDGVPSYIPSGIPIKLHDELREKLQKSTGKEIIEKFESEGFLLAREPNQAAGLVFFAVSSIKDQKKTFVQKSGFLWCIVFSIIGIPLGVVLFFRKNQGLTLGLKWQVVGLFSLTLGLPFAIIFQLSQDLHFNLRKAGEGLGFELIEETIDKVTGSYKLVLNDYEKKCEKLSRIILESKLDPTKTLSAEQQNDLVPKLRNAGQDSGASSLLLINDSCKAIHSQGLHWRVSAEREAKAVEPLMCAIVRMKFELNGIPIHEKGGQHFMDLVFQQLGGNINSIKMALRLGSQAFIIKAFDKTLYVYITILQPNPASNRRVAMVVFGGGRQFEQEFFQAFINDLYVRKEIPQGVEIYGIQIDRDIDEDFIPKYGPAAHYDRSKGPSADQFRQDVVSLAAPTLNAGITIREANFFHKEKHFIFQSVKPPVFENFIVVSFYDYSLIEKYIKALWSKTCWDLGFSVAIAFLLGWLFSRGILSPVGKLKDGVSLVANSEYDTRITIPGKDEMVELAESFNSMAHGLWERAKMSRYLSRAALEAVKEASETKLWGEQMSGTILFSDIRAFTTISEGTDPLGVVKLLNEYFSRMTQVIFSFEGDISKFIGDAVMAIFKPSKENSSPEYHAKQAVFCGLAMMEALDALNRQRKAYNQFPISVGIGINSGDLIAGNIGAPGRMEHAIIGDNVNIALRLNKMSRFGKHSRVIISRATFDLVQGSIEAEKMIGTSIKGRTQAVEMYEVIRRIS